MRRISSMAFGWPIEQDLGLDSRLPHATANHRPAQPVPFVDIQDFSGHRHRAASKFELIRTII